MKDTNTTLTREYHNSSIIPSKSIRFTLLLIFEIPSIICYIFVISYILNKKSLRSASNNYIMLIILFISFGIVTIDIPWEIEYYRQHTIPIQSSTFCMIWCFIDICFFYLCQILIAWASFERHILIFHDRLLNQKWKNICFHYIPPVILICYMWTFYIYAIFLFPCDSYVDFKKQRCAVPCYIYDRVLGLWEAIFHSIFSTTCIIVFGFALLIRVHRSKTRLQQSVNWRNYRKMLFQLISIASLYLLINFPLSIIHIVSMTSTSDEKLTVLENLSFCTYFIPLFLPFIYLTSLPGIWKKLKWSIHHRMNRRIQPTTSHISVRHEYPQVEPA